ncbi:SLAM family member 9 [Labeo rohita]|uniref:SLAM family member 9 n=1 Tax=Labeo rohita TaxID=84645 RepID=A0ABQ8LK25_LABRO|nr:SLAM family member 9 [Labeo rohita]
MSQVAESAGVFGDSDTVKMVKEGDSVTLESGVTELQTDYVMTWTFKRPDITIAKINKEAKAFNIYNDVLDGRFRGRLKLDHQTGSLNITNTRTTDSGLYQLTISAEQEKKTDSLLLSMSFRWEQPNVKVIRLSIAYIHVPFWSADVFLMAYCGSHAITRLPVPNITRNCSSSSSSSSSSQQNCSLLCSVVNVSDVSLSWYKGNSLLSSISVSDLGISLSLPLEVEYQDKNTYSCVINNPISNQTTHLDISKLCHTCAGT